MTELVLILLLVGVLAAFAVPRINIEGFQQRAFSGELVNALRYAQKTAISSGCPVRATIDAAGYSLEYTGDGGSACGTGATALRHPTRSGTFSGSGEITTGGSVIFDGMGRTGSALSITLADGSSVVVEAQTGYVHR